MRFNNADNETGRLSDRNAGSERDENVTRRQFLKSTATAVTACALGGTTLISTPVKAAAPVWSAIPNQRWEVGKPVHLDLADYVTDPDGDPLIFSVDLPLPPGVQRNGSVISGTPTANFATSQFTVTADDGTPEESRPLPPTNVQTQQ